MTDKTAPIQTLPGKLASEIARVTKLSALYKSLPGGAGTIGAAMMDRSLTFALMAANSPDVVGQIRAVKDLQEFTK